MKKSIALIFLVMAILGIITISAFANTSSNEENQTDDPSEYESTLSVESIEPPQTSSDIESEIVSSEEEPQTSSKSIGEVIVSSIPAATSSQSYVSSRRTYATDKTSSVEQWGDAQSKVDISDIESQATSSKETNEKNIFNLSKFLKRIIIIPILLIVGCIVALIKVNSKSFLNASAANKKTDGFDTGEIDISSKAKRRGGKHTRRKRK